jgi:hypothetical protein
VFDTPTKENGRAAYIIDRAEFERTYVVKAALHLGSFVDLSVQASYRQKCRIPKARGWG